MPKIGVGTITVEGSDGPPIQLWAGPEGFHVRAQLPGLSAGELEVDLQGGSLTLTGTRPRWEGGQARQFTRRVHLPIRLDPSEATASLLDGFLEMDIPFEAQMRRVRIPVGGDPTTALTTTERSSDTKPTRSVDRFESQRETASAKTRARETPTEYLITVEVPGSTAEGVRVDVEGDELRVAARRDAKEPKNMQLVMGELATGDWIANLHIPEDVFEDQIETDVRFGEVRLRMPRGKVSEG
ncbi:MAG: HSP20 family molecular chaperone IbpA [Planctomycetota bacterium]|jgi:HSP20 family molecular chaperone IbpA